MRSAVIVTVVLLVSCSTPAPQTGAPAAVQRTVTAFEPPSGDVQALLVAARTAPPRRANEYRIKAASAMSRSGEAIKPLLDAVDTDAASPDQLRRYLMLRARDSLTKADPAGDMVRKMATKKGLEVAAKSVEKYLAMSNASLNAHAFAGELRVRGGTLEARLRMERPSLVLLTFTANASFM